MSLPVQNIRCRGCDFRQVDPRRPIILRYMLPDGSILEIGRRRGWCHACNETKDIEPSFDGATIARDLHGTNDEKRANELRLQLRLAGMRRSPPRCLHCGKAPAVPISFGPDGTSSDFLHDCGSNLYTLPEESSDLRLSFRLAVIELDHEGRRLSGTDSSARGFAGLSTMLTNVTEATKDLGVGPVSSPALPSQQRTKAKGKAPAPTPSDNGATDLTSPSATSPGLWAFPPGPYHLLIAIGVLVTAGMAARINSKWPATPLDRPPVDAGDPKQLPLPPKATPLPMPTATPLPMPQPVPPSGVHYRNGAFGGRSRFVAPLEIETARGIHFLVKLVHVDSGETAMTVFARSGETVQVKAPLGTFEIKYASGDTWYGDDLLFGPKTSYNKADTLFEFEVVGNQIQGYTITLYRVTDGNLSTSSIRPSEF